MKYQSIQQLEDEFAASPNGSITMVQIRELYKLYSMHENSMIFFDTKDEAIRKALQFYVTPANVSSYPNICQAIKQVKDLGYI